MKKYSANKEAVSACFKYFEESSEHTVTAFLKSHNLWVSEEKTSKGVKVCCPFHRDSTPSLQVYDDGGWHCFSCGRGKTYFDMVVGYTREIEHSQAGFYQILNNLLAADTRMQLSTGYASIYRVERSRLQDKFVRPRFIKPERKTILTYMELANIMIKENLNSISAIKLSILYMQAGYTPEEIYEMITQSPVVDQGTEEDYEQSMSSSLNLSDILGDLNMFGEET